MKGKYLLLMLVLASCNLGNSPGTADADYFRGQNGLEIRFVERAPPVQMYEGMSFPVTVAIKNIGASDVPLAGPDGQVRSAPAQVILNFDNVYLQYAQDESAEEVQKRLDNLTIRGRSDLVPQGEEKIVKLANLKTNQIIGQRESPETQIFASICYPYRTTLSTDICMDSATQERNLRDQVCRARDLSFSAGQGAPVSITLVEVEMLPIGDAIRPTFIVHVDNTGSGTVLRSLQGASNLGDICSLRSDTRELNTVDVRADLAGVPLDCSPNPVHVGKGAGRFFCKVNETDIEVNPALFRRQDNFITSLNIELEYLYSTSTSVDMEILRTPGEFYNDTFPDSTQTQTPWLEGGQERCMSKGSGYSCTCNFDKCLDLYGQGRRCTFEADLCAPGSFCCQREACSDHDDDRPACTSSSLGCVYCEGNDLCETSCSNCGHPFSQNGNICEVQDES